MHTPEQLQPGLPLLRAEPAHPNQGVIGSTMGTQAEFNDLLEFLAATGLRPRIDRVIPAERAREGLAAMESGAVSGKIVLKF
jgi:D-arabinose 1-dehydrogenase-like Zn-dependent alcohol dehydrogenase